MAVLQANQRTINALQKADRIAIMANRRGGGKIGGGFAAPNTYSGYFTVISSGNGYKVVFGGDTTNAYCGTLTVGGQMDISIPASPVFSASGVSLIIYYDTGNSLYKTMWSFEGTPPTAKYVSILLASIVDGVITQQWTNGAINLNYMGYVV